MTLVIDELYTGVKFEQNFRINQSLSIAHIRPWIYKHGVLASGVLTLDVYQDTRLLKKIEIDYTTINNIIPGTYAHGQIRFDCNSLQLNHDTKNEWTVYRIELYMNNYTNNSTKFIGTCRRYEHNFYTVYGAVDINGDGLNDMIEPLGYEIFEYEYQR